MAVLLTVPLRSDLPRYQFRISFSGVIFTAHVRYNTRMQRYLMNICDSSDNPILLGIPVLIERDLTAQYPTLAVPAGTFFVTDDSGQEQQPTQYSFGIDHTMWYVDPTQGSA